MVCYPRNPSYMNNCVFYDFECAENTKPSIISTGVTIDRLYNGFLLVLSGGRLGSLYSTWRIIPGSKWLITMVSKSPE